MFSSETSNSLDGDLSHALWNRIAHKTRRCPLLDGTPRIVRRGGRTALGSSRQSFFFAGAGVAAGVAVFVVGIYPRLWWYFPRLPVPWFLSHDLIAAVALGFAAISALGLARANRIKLDGGSVGGQLEIVQGLFPFVTRLRARLDELSVRLSVADGKSTFPSGNVVLSLYREDAEGRPIHIAAVAAARRALEPAPGDVISAIEPGRDLGAAYSCLAQRMKADDQTVARLALPERGEIVTPKTPLGFLCSSASYRLAFSDADHAVFLPTKSNWGFSFSFFLLSSFGLAFLWIGRLTRADDSDRFSLWIGLFTVFLMVLLGSVFALMHRYEVACDRQSLSIRRHNLFPWPTQSQRWPTSSVAAVQICPRVVSGNVAYIAWFSYELNLILRQPPGERLSLLLYRGDLAALRADAAALAQFLQAPLLDHSRAPDGS